MKKTIFIIYVLNVVINFSFAQNTGINTDGSIPETGVMLDVKIPTAKATTSVVATYFQIKSFDANTDALKLRLGFKTDAAAGNRYGFIDFPDFIGGTPTYRDLALQPSGGSVGIGTTSPLAALHISANNANLRMTDISVGGDDYGIINNVSGLGGPVFGVYNFTDSRTEIGFMGNGDVVIMNGNVGIGTTNPIAKLMVDGPSGFSDETLFILNKTGGFGETKFVQYYRNNTNGGASSDYGTELHIGGTIVANFEGDASAATRRVSFSNSNVGIATVNPDALLEIVLSSGVPASGAFRVSRALGQSTYISPLYGGGPFFSYIGTLTGGVEKNNITLHTGGNVSFENGNVGIGVNSASVKLEVVGTSGTTLKIVDSNQGLGKILTSDANGVASWATGPTASGSGYTVLLYNNEADNTYAGTTVPARTYALAANTYSQIMVEAEVFMNAGTWIFTINYNGAAVQTLTLTNAGIAGGIVKYCAPATGAQNLTLDITRTGGTSGSVTGFRVYGVY